MHRQSEKDPEVYRSSPRWWRVFGVVIVALVFGVLMRATLLLAAPASAPASAPAGANLAQEPNHGGDDDFAEHHGILSSRPVTEVGTWVIEGKSFSATESTEFDGEPEEIALGECVQVKYLVSEPTDALRIREVPAHECDGHDDDLVGRYGIINDRPDGEVTVGMWIISGTTYTVTESTLLEGDLSVDACVEVKARESEPTVAIKIEARDAYKCGRGDGGDDDHEFIRDYGFIRSRPEGKVGTWVIGGNPYEAVERTDLERDHGSLEVGACAAVVALKGVPAIAVKIESERTYKCHEDSDGGARAVLYGAIESLPPDLQNGIWQIGGISFTVVPTTTLVRNAAIFTEGVTVKVIFTTGENETNLAHWIEIKLAPCRRDQKDDDHRDKPDHDGGDDDDRRYGFCPGREGSTFGLIESRPDGTLIGQWMIGGVPYLTTASTQFHHDDDFLVGKRVKVEYVVLNDNIRRATKIRETDIGGVSDPSHSLIVGTVFTKPEDKFVGDWVISGAPFVAVSETTFIEHNALLIVGAFVVVEYEITNDERVMIKIVAHVPPGAGDDHKFGRLESTGGVAVASAAVPAQISEVWTVDGVDYVVTEATQLVDAGGELVAGATVYVNSYTADGQRYATMIRSQSGRAFMPLTLR